MRNTNDGERSNALYGDKLRITRIFEVRWRSLHAVAFFQRGGDTDSPVYEVPLFVRPSRNGNQFLEFMNE